MNPTPPLEEAIDRLIASRIRKIRVGLPAQVLDYDAATQSCTVQPLIQDGYYDDTNTRQVRRVATVSHVPVVFQSGGGCSDTFPIAAGDTVWLAFSSSAIGLWKMLGGEVDPGDDRRHDISDAVAFPGLHDLAHPLPSSAVDPVARVINAPQVKVGDNTASDGVARKSDLQDFLAALQNASATVGPPANAPLVALIAELTTLPGPMPGPAAPHAGQAWPVASTMLVTK